MAFQYASLIAIIHGIFYPVTMISVYIVAAYRGQVYPILPYISDTGAHRPESSFFGLILTTAAALTTACIYMRYGLIKHICQSHEVEKNILKWNKIGLITGLFITIPETIVANFGVIEMTLVHMIIASAGMTGICFYLCIQARISYQLYPILGDWKTNIARYIIASISCVLYSFMCTCGVLSIIYYEATACIYMRYGLIKHICLTHKVEKIILKWNKIGLIAGMFMPIPEIICGSFGVIDMAVVHLITASTGITGACLYLCIQAWISYNLYPIIGDWKTNIARYVIASISCVLYSSLCTCAVLSVIYYEGDISEFDFPKWSPEHGGYKYHVVSALSEWLLIFSISTFISTYMVEFKDIVISEPEFSLQRIGGDPEEKAEHNEEAADK